MAENPNADGSAPWYEVGAMSPINDYAFSIDISVSAHGVDTRLLRTIMFMETTQRHYFWVEAAAGHFDQNKSILPMIINVKYWGDAFGSKQFLNNAHHNIWAGAKIFSSIQTNMPNASIAQISKVYNNVNETRVSDYGARVSAIYDSQPWK